MSEVEQPNTLVRLAYVRLAIGFLQGLAAWQLIRSAERPWSAAHPGLFAALVLVTAFGPLIPLAGLGHLRLRTLLVWTGAACVLVAGLAAYDLWREPYELYGPGTDVRRWPSPQLIFFNAAALYIAHHLIEPADVERRWWPDYRLRFEIAWRHGFQLALSLLFAFVFWLVLQLGAALFDTIGVKAVGETVRKAWFASPATATAFAAAVHLTDVKPALIRGVRTVGLTLLAWLTPLACLLTAAFLLTLPFAGLTKLGATKQTTMLLLSAAGLLVVLLNAAYQDGQEREAVARLLRWTVRVGGVLLVPLVLLATWATGLRVAQYGLTPGRVVGLALLLPAAVYEGGYA